MPVDHEHRPGLRCHLRTRALLQVGSGLEHAYPITTHEKHAVRLHVEVARSGLRVDVNKFATVLDVKSDRFETVIEHSCIGSKEQRTRTLVPLLRNGSKKTIRASVFSLPEQLN